MPKNDAFKRLLGEYLLDPRGRNLLWAHIETMPERLGGEKKSEIKQFIDDIGRLKNQSPNLDRLIQIQQKDIQDQQALRCLQNSL